jgi:DNA-binding transcriptional ArsR family regulator
MIALDQPRQIDALRAAAGQACALMKVMSNPDRLLLMCELAGGEKNVGELQEATGIVQPSLSQQLGVLRDEEVVATRRDGKNIYYSLSSPQAMAVMGALYEQFCGKRRGAARKGVRGGQR